MSPRKAQRAEQERERTRHLTEAGRRMLQLCVGGVSGWGVGVTRASGGNVITGPAPGLSLPRTRAGWHVAHRAPVTAAAGHTSGQPGPAGGAPRPTGANQSLGVQVSPEHPTRLPARRSGAEVPERTRGQCGPQGVHGGSPRKLSLSPTPALPPQRCQAPPTLGARPVCGSTPPRPAATNAASTDARPPHPMAGSALLLQVPGGWRWEHRARLCA